MNCQACQIEIEELELGEPLSDAASKHVKLCVSCHAFHDERQSLRRLVGGLGTVSAPPDFEFRLRARLAAVSNGGSRHFSLRTFLSSAPAVALAASFALLVAGVIIYKQVRTKPETVKTPDIAKVNEQKTNDAAGAPSPESKTTSPEKERASVIQAAGSKQQPALLTAKNQNPSRHQQRQIEASPQQIVSGDIAVKGAPSIRPANGSNTIDVSNQLVQLPVRSPMQPVRVSLDDKNGAKRTVTLEPVVFGSQDFTGRNLSRNVSPSDIW
jgi:hypothetical protein